VKKRKVLYCKDQAGSLFDESCLIFNIDKLDTPFTRNGDWELGDSRDGSGLTRSYLYAACAHSAFAGNISD
jgi:hypothetical protein